MRAVTERPGRICSLVMAPSIQNGVESASTSAKNRNGEATEIDGSELARIENYLRVLSRWPIKQCLRTAQQVLVEERN